jgi:hypothetical protein
MSVITKKPLFAIFTFNGHTRAEGSTQERKQCENIAFRIMPGLISALILIVHKFGRLVNSDFDTRD